MKIKIICNISILYVLSQYDYILCKSLFFISNSKIHTVKGEKKQQQLTTARTFEFSIKGCSLHFFFFFFSLELIGEEFGLSVLGNRMLRTSKVAKVRYRHVNGEEDSESKLSLPNILFTTFIIAINPMKHTLIIFLC